MKKLFSFFKTSPHPTPFPKGEGTRHFSNMSRPQPKGEGTRRFSTTNLPSPAGREPALSLPKGAGGEGGWLLLSLFLLTLLLSLAAASPALAQSPNPPPSDDEVNAIARDLYCPVCENTPLDVCPTQACIQWRDLIRLKLSQGESEEEIKQYFVEHYGARVLSAPPFDGFYALIYIVPPIVLAIGLFVFYRSFRAMLKPAPDTGPDDSPEEFPPASAGASSDDYLRRVEDELKKRD
jgi:cytochrome c-type biogenesis protein CcmH